MLYYLLFPIICLCEWRHSRRQRRQAIRNRRGPGSVGVRIVNHKAFQSRLDAIEENEG